MNPSTPRHSPHALDEYKDLRAEMLQSQQTRILILGFSFTLVAAFSGIALGQGDGQPPRDDVVTGLMALGQLLVAAAVQLTTVLTQRIDLQSQYIRRHLEGELKFGWETDWAEYRNKMKRYLGRGNLPLGTSKPLSFSYAVLLGADLLVYFIVAQAPDAVEMVLVFVSAAIAAYFTANLYWRFRWHLGWTGLYDSFQWQGRRRFRTLR
jgi:hypothetical protein